MNLDPFKIEHYFRQHEFTARYLLSSSDCETLSIRDLLAFEPDATEQFLSHRLGYTETTGAPWLREQIAPIYTTIAPEQVLVFAGAEEPIFLFLHALLEPGSHAIIQTPCYQSAIAVSKSIGCQITSWPMRLDHGWEPDLDAVERTIRPQTRVLFLNTPHNPTGYHFHREAFERLVALAREHGIILFCDEVYRELEHDPALRLPAACDVYENAVSLGVMSKTYGLPGLRIGWVATRNAAILSRMIALKDYTTICNSAPSEFLAALALRHRDQIAARNLAIVERNMPLLDAFFERFADRFSWVKPHAGPIGFPRLHGQGDVEAFCAQVVERCGVLLLPGTVYDYPGHFRIGFGRDTLSAALTQLTTYLEQGES